MVFNGSGAQLPGRFRVGLEGVSDGENKASPDGKESVQGGTSEKQDSKSAGQQPSGATLREFLSSIASSFSNLGFATRNVLTGILALVAAYFLLTIVDKLIYFYLAKSYVDEISEAYDLNKHLASALVFLTFLAAAFCGRYLWSFSKRKRLIGIAGLLALLIGHSLAMWGATRNATISAKGVSLKCYVITRDGHVIYRERPGIDPSTGRECRPVTPDLVERLSQYEKGRRPQRIATFDPTFFDPRSGDPIVWYTRTRANAIELFDLMGFDPDTGDDLKPITKEIVDEWKNQISQQAQQLSRCSPRRVDPASFVFFDSQTGNPRGWYWKDANNNYEFYDCAGYRPENGDELQPVTREIINTWKANFACRDNVPQQIDPHSYSFFDPATGAARVWYWQGNDGAVEFYNACGFQPRTGDKLQAVTHEFAEEWARDQKTRVLEPQLKNQADAFIISLYTVLSGPNDQIIGVLSKIYADQVKYFGKPQSRDEVLSDQQAYFGRWPNRRFSPRPDSIQISCDTADLSCVARGILDYDHTSIERNAHAWGVATFYYVLKFSTPDSIPSIVEESGATTDHHLEPLPAVQYQSPPPQYPPAQDPRAAIINNVLNNILSHVR